MIKPESSTANALLRSVPVVCAVLLSSFLASCSTLSGGASDFVYEGDQIDSSRVAAEQPIATNRSSLIARDLIGAMIQIPELDPASLVLGFAIPETSYGRVLALELQRAGYDMRLSNNRQIADFLSYSIRSTNSPEAKTYEFIVSIGQVKLKRSYGLEAGRIFPVSSLYVQGVSPGNIAMNDAVFLEQGGNTGEEPSNLVVTPLADSTAKTFPTRESARLVANRDEPLDDSSLYLSRSEVAQSDFGQKFPGQSDLGLSVRKKENMYVTRQSNFAALWDDYVDVQKEILIFMNDSSLLGKRNKALTRRLINGFNSDTDVISVIGCSHGKTGLSDGNRKLALGRSSRVREEIILSGVNPGYVLDEGCWAPRHFDVFPRRGVVLTLKRLRVPG